jgi:hypothetical protein
MSREKILLFLSIYYEIDRFYGYKKTDRFYKQTLTLTALLPLKPGTCQALDKIAL